MPPPVVSGISPLATRQAQRLRDVKDRPGNVYGVAIHCTGSGIVAKAMAAGLDPFDEVVAFYTNPTNPYFAQYAINYDGTIAQVADEHENAQHVGFGAAVRQSFLDGSWATQLPRAYVDAWHARWKAYKSPARLFPGTSVNSVYVGIELLVWQPGCDGAPMRPGLKYTEAQHRACAALAGDIAARWIFPTGWQRTGRLACHEDLNPLERTSGGKGWVPGCLRPGGDPWLDWGALLGFIAGPAGDVA